MYNLSEFRQHEKSNQQTLSVYVLLNRFKSGHKHYILF